MIVPSFPKFHRLTLEDKDSYNELVAAYPPFSNIAFSSIQIWNNQEDELSISSLKDNLIIKYYLSFDEKNSGLSILGKNRVDETIREILKHLQSAGQPAKLIHVPEFIIKEIERPENFRVEEEPDYHEYILDSEALSKLEGSQHGKTRRQVNHFKRAMENRKLEAKPLDLSTDEAKERLFRQIVAWEKTQRNTNDPESTEHKALRRALAHAGHLDIKHLGLYIDDRLHAVILYQKTRDQNYFIINHLRVNYSIPFIYDYMTHHIANQALQENVKYLNMEMDLGIENLKSHKMGYRPVDFFRQYSIYPLNQ
jgi:hypothetical protein